MPGISRTSVWVAMGRAFGARDPDARVRNPDILAEALMGPEERALLGDHPLVDALNQPYAEASRNMEVVMASRSMIPRTRFIDARLEAAVQDGTTQVVILGAGFDTRAYRLRGLLAGIRIFEVDHPDTQDRKMQRAREALGEPPANLVYVAVDFRHDDLGARLAAAGYRRDKKTFFLWEGVTMYLPAEAVKATLRWIAGNSPPGSIVVFDYTSETTIRVMANPDGFPIPPDMKQAIERFRKIIAGEPWIFGIPDGLEREFLAALGLSLRKVLGLNSEEAVKNYLTRKDGSIFGGLPASDRQGYLILEAAVEESRS